MAKTVFVLGAGASQKAGAPLMAGFMKAARDLKEKGDDHTHFKKVFRAVRDLRQVHYKSYLDLDNIEEVFGAFEMGRLVGRLGDYPQEEIDELSRAVNRLIVRTLEQTVHIPVQKTRISPAPPYGDFVSMLGRIQSQGGPARCSVLTFNYDVALDHALYTHEFCADYCLPAARRKGSLRLLKLHGSINWARCPECKSIVPWDLRDYFARSRYPIDGTTKYLILNIGSRFSEFSHCKRAVSDEPVLVPPTWSKTEYHAQLSQVWQQAAQELSEAEDIFVIGYSLPESDLFFRYLFALGTISDVELERFWVFDPDESGYVRERYDRLIGRSLERRYRFENKTFEEAIPIIAGELHAG